MTVFKDKGSGLVVGAQFKDQIINPCIAAVRSADGDANAITNYNDCSNEIGELLVGAGVWTGTQLNIVSVGSVDLCSLDGVQLAGYVEGNSVIYKVWKAAEDRVYDACAACGWGPRLR